MIEVTDTAVASFDDAAEGIEQSRTDGKGLNESHAKGCKIDAQFKEQADEYLEIMWYEFHDE